MSRRHSLIGASKPYLYKEEDAEFYYRQTSGGVIMNNSPLVGSIDRIKGQTIAWNQQIIDSSISGNRTQVATENYIFSFLNTNRYVFLGHKVFIKGKVLVNTTSFSQMNLQIDNQAVYHFKGKIVAGEEKEFSVITPTITSNNWHEIRLYATGLTPGDGMTITWSDMNAFDLTLIYGAGNEPSTPEQFEADYQRRFGKPLTYEPYDEGSLRNVQMEGIKTTFTNASPQTKSFDVTSITGKLNGEGESVVIFPDGMKGVNDVKDEIYIEDGITKAVKRVGRVDLGSLTTNYINGIFVYFPPNMKPTLDYVSRNTGFLSAKYMPDVQISISSAAMTDKTALRNSNSGLYIKDTSYTDAATFKTAMQGVYLDYELAEPQVYVLDTPLPLAYNCEAGGTEQILPEEIGTGIAPIMDIKYNIGQINN